MPCEYLSNYKPFMDIPTRNLSPKVRVLTHFVWNNDVINTWHYSSQMVMSFHNSLFFIKINIVS